MGFPRATLLLVRECSGLNSTRGDGVRHAFGSEKMGAVVPVGERRSDRLSNYV